MEEFKVESIVDHKTRTNGTGVKAWFYLIKWAGYGHDQNTWTPAGDFHGSDVILKYHVSRAKHGGRRPGSIEPFAVEDILQTKAHNGAFFYLVHWDAKASLDTDPHARQFEFTWEMEDAFQDDASSSALTQWYTLAKGQWTDFGFEELVSIGLICPILTELMLRPMTTVCGHSFDCKAINIMYEQASEWGAADECEEARTRTRPSTQACWLRCPICETRLGRQEEATKQNTLAQRAVDAVRKILRARPLGARAAFSSVRQRATPGFKSELSKKEQVAEKAVISAVSAAVRRRCAQKENAPRISFTVLDQKCDNNKFVTWMQCNSSWLNPRCLVPALPFWTRLQPSKKVGVCNLKDVI